MTHTIQISETIYRRLQRQATARHTTVDALADETLSRALPPALDDFPEKWRSDLEQMHTMSDKMLWRLLAATYPPEREQRYDALLQARSEGALTPSEEAQISVMRAERDLLLLRRSYALLLLQWRGHEIPNPYDAEVDG